MQQERGPLSPRPCHLPGPDHSRESRARYPGLSMQGQGMLGPVGRAVEGFISVPPWCHPQHRKGPGHSPPRWDCTGPELPPQ